METLTDYELARLKDLRRRIRDGEYDLDRMPDAAYLRAAYWITEHAGSLIAGAMFVGVFIFIGGLFWIAVQPW